MNCRFCAAPLSQRFLDLGTAPPSNAYLAPAQLAAAEAWFPLRLHACMACLLVQVDAVAHGELFQPDYAYFSSFSSTWLAHAEAFVDLATRRHGLDARSFVVEVASNDGYLLQYVAARGIPCLGVEPTQGTADAARGRGIDTLVRFFGRDCAADIVRERGQADLVVGNNVLAHVPDLDDFVGGLARLLAPAGVLSLEFPHLLELVAGRQFDTVYHEHFSYFSLHTVRTVLGAHGLAVFDVETLPTHGGSLRVWAGQAAHGRAPTPAVAALLARERDAGMLEAGFYADFQAVAEKVKDDFLAFLLEQKRAGRTVAAYGAAAKGNTLLNFAGVRADLLPFVVDASPHKQGRYLPGSRIPIVAEARLREARPDFVVVLPWNLMDEITRQLHYVREWGGRFVRAVPALEVS